MSAFFQLIQDEIKALVQLQNRQASIQSNTELSPTPVSKITANTKDYIYPPLSSDCIVPKNVSSDNINLETSAGTLVSSPPTTQSIETTNHADERATTVLSSGYGTLSAWDTGLEPAESPREEECGRRQKEKDHCLSSDQKDTETPVTGSKKHPNREGTVKVKEAFQLVHQQRMSGYVWVKKNKDNQFNIKKSSCLARS